MKKKKQEVTYWVYELEYRESEYVNEFPVCHGTMAEIVRYMGTKAATVHSYRYLGRAVNGRYMVYKDSELEPRKRKN